MKHWLYVKIDADGVLVDSAIVDDQTEALSLALDNIQASFQDYARKELSKDGQFWHAGHMHYITQPRQG